MIPKRPTSASDPVDYEHRTTVNLIAVIVILILGASFYWVAHTLDQRRKLEICLATGRKNCYALPSQHGGIVAPDR